MTDYEKLLNEAYEKIKPIAGKRERFEVPEPKALIEGNKTIITNFLQIASYLRRDPQHLKKYLEKELAAPGKLDKDRLILVRKLLKERISEKIKSYVGEFVICKECGKPDTELLRQDGFMFVHCLACGAKHSVRAKIR